MTATKKSCRLLLTTLLRLVSQLCHTALHNYTALRVGGGSAALTTSFILPFIMKAREYCCCAIPLVNAGIYLTLTEHVFVSLLVGIVSVATPSSEYYNFGYLRLYTDNTFFFSSCRGVYALICILDISYHLLCCHRCAAPRIYWCCQGKFDLPCLTSNWQCYLCRKKLFCIDDMLHYMA